MPQATDELRQRWDGPDDAKALDFLEKAGYKLTPNWSWIPPANHTPTEEELSAIDFMIQEWDYGCLVGGGS